MRIHIFDVEHGACNVIETPNGQIIMIDCGHNSSTNWRPSTWIASKRLTVANLTVSNVDEDHVSDLTNMSRFCQIDTLKTNPNLVPDYISRMKQQTGGLGKGIAELVRLMRDVYTGSGSVIDFGLERFRFSHSPTNFTDFNNLSLVTFFFYGEFGIVFPGDIEKAGWERFLLDPEFRKCLQRTTIFVASHHGRISGYCQDVFQYCHPRIVLVSDKEVQHQTQQHSLYNQHAVGLSNGTETRYVLTTRNDGKLTIDNIDLLGNFTIHTS
jgi:beta-lactamase superfamily II metal-dependent hydrolase